VGLESMNEGKNSWKVTYQKNIRYDIVTSENLFDANNESLLMGGRKKDCRRFVVVDEFIYNLYGEDIEKYFEKKQIVCKIMAIPSGEPNKTPESYINLFKELDEFPIDRRSEPIIAIGGGVVTDIVGFVASTYRRGIPHIKIPTTLMGYIDAAVGIKTGVNFNGNKNRMGSFEPPKAVILDKTFLNTLSDRHILNGVGEILKLAVIKDFHIFECLEAEGSACIEDKFQGAGGEQILKLSIEGMLEELEPNLYEDDLQRCVDFGHTFSPMLEMKAVDHLLHGEAVAIDIAFSVSLAKVLSLLSHLEWEQVLNLMMKLNLPYYHNALAPDLLWNSLVERTHHRDGMQRVPLPLSIGECIFVNNIRYEDIVGACSLLEQAARQYSERIA
jgi:3-dehydroquinate synthase